jgi:U3 small nucleolar RNA-associated protein 10
MGNHMIRQDDTYSTQLIQQTVFTIIPSLVSAGKGKLSEVSRLVVAAGIFRVFASAVQDIPVHRRLPIFTSLVETLQPEFSLWLFCIIIVDSALQRDRKKYGLFVQIHL